VSLDPFSEQKDGYSILPGLVFHVLCIFTVMVVGISCLDRHGDIHICRLPCFPPK
jgi:hypothetical protein